jgi:DHA3 family macrolide efflux protein-like MFS transporter
MKDVAINWKRNLTLLLLGQSLTIFASVLAAYAILWHVTLESGSGVAMTLLTLAKFVPQFLVSPLAGVWADRYNKKLIINLSDSFVAVTTLVVAIFFSIGYEYIFLLLICNVARGIGHGVLMPTFNSILPAIVPREEMIRVNGISQSIQSISQMAAPAIAGAMMTFLPIQTILYFDVATAAIGILILVFFVKVPKTKAPSKLRSTIEELKTGLGYIAKDKVVKWVIVVGSIMNFMIGPIVFLVPLQVVRIYGGEAWRLAVVELAFFGGMALGGAIIGAWGGFKDKAKTMFVAILFCGILMALMGAYQNFIFFMIIRSFAGVFVSMFRPPMVTILQLRVEPEFLGRIFALMSMLTTVVLPLGMLIWGPLADTMNINLIFIFCGIGVIGLSLLFVFSKTLKSGGKL